MQLLPQPTVPNVSGSLSGIASVLEENRERDRTTRKRDELKNEFITAYQSNDPMQMAAFYGKYPDAGKAMDLALGHRNDATSESYTQMMRDTVQDPSRALDYAKDHRDFVVQQGGTTQQTDAYINQISGLMESGEDPDAITKRIQNTALMDLASRDPEAVEQFNLMNNIGGAATKVGARKIYTNGVVVQSTPQGQVVWKKDGTRAAPEEIESTIKEANDEEIRLAAMEAGDVTRSRVAVTNSAKNAEDASEYYINTQSQIRSYDDAIKQIDAGATTGVVYNLFPDFRASTLALRNIGNKLALGLLSTVSMGALSEKELTMLQQTAMPIGMAPEKLREWLVDRRDAEKKLSDFYLEAAQYFDAGGSRPEFLAMKEAQNLAKDLPRVDEKGGTLQVDKKGNAAYVYPDGAFKQIKLK